MIILFFLLAPAAFGDIRPLKKFDVLDIEADNINTNRAKNLVIFEGKVVALQKNNNLKFFSDKMNLEYGVDKNDKISIKTMHTYGNVVIKRDHVTISGGFGLYDVEKNIITMRDNVVLSDSVGKAYGDTVIYDVTNDSTQVFGKKNKKKQKQVVIIVDDVKKAKENYGKQK
jgi:lipopolysaccharide transport protein LptA